MMAPGPQLQRNWKEFEKLYLAQLSQWRRVSPAVDAEKRSLLPAYSAAWIIVLSGDEEQIEAIRPDLRRMLELPDYAKLYYATFFYAENLIYFLNGNI